MSRMIWPVVIVLALLCSCQGRELKKGVRKMEIKVSSGAFKEGEMIPSKYTCDGVDISPPLAWENVPTGAESIALICDDPDAPRGDFVHWVIYDMPASVKELPEHVPTEKTLANGGKQGANDFGRIGYGGPCPPSGTHRYYFKLYALDRMLKLEPSARKPQLLEAMRGHILAQGQLMGRYIRKATR